MRDEMMERLQNGNLEIGVSEEGAELTSVRHKGIERLWQNENGGWAGHAPVLFPVCGACEVRVDGKIFACPRHGFAMKSRFDLVGRTDRSVRFRLSSDEGTKALYPYDFIFETEYKIEGDELEITYEIFNPQEKKLYFSCGGHDSFRLDGEPFGYELAFERDEKFESLLVDERGYLTGGIRPLGEGKILDLSTDLLEQGNSICLDRLGSGWVILREKGTGKKIVKVEFPDSEKLVLWRPHGAKMLCIEPWQNLPDLAGEEAEFPQKKGVIAVEGFGKARVTRKITYY